MPEFWIKSKDRGQETVAVWRRFRPLMAVGGTLPDAHAANVARLEPLARTLAEARTGLRTAEQAELAAFTRIRSLNLSVPLLIAGRFDQGHSVRSALGAVFELVPRSAELNLRRARRLIAVWRKANAALAVRKPGDVIVRDEVGVADFARLVAEYPQAGEAIAEAEVVFHLARTALREQNRLVDRMNKRAYGKLKAEGRADADLALALAMAITREKPSGSRLRQQPREKRGKAVV